MPYEVEYMRNGIVDTFLTKDKFRAEEFAIKYNGTIHELVRTYQWPVQQSVQLSTTNEGEFSQKE